jgi:hypothetical protein
LVSLRIWLNMRKKMQKNNRTLNQEHERRTADRVRPKQPEYDFKPLEEIVRKWVKGNE